MKVSVNVVGVYPEPVDVTWPEGWPIPPEGATVTIPGFDTVNSVRTVVWYPQGDANEGPEWAEPFVYIVLGPRSPR